MRITVPRRPVGAVLFLACAAMLSRHASADATIAVGKSAAFSDATIPVNVGAALGFFKKHGLDVKILDFNGGSAMMQALVAGSIDIAAGDGTQMAFAAKGAPMIAVCENTSTLPYFSIGVPWDSPIKTKGELKGKRIGVSATASLTDYLAQELVKSEGWPSGAITEVSIGTGIESASAAFRAHLIDADISATTSFLVMERNKIGRILIPVSDYVGNIAAGVLYASNTLINKNPDAVRAFLAAWLETTSFMRTHKPETVKTEAKITNYPESILSKEYDIVIAMFTPDCKFDPQSLANLDQSLIELNLVKTPPDMSKLYTEAYLPGR